MLGGVMKEEDFIFNDEPLCNEDDLIDYNKQLQRYNYRTLLYCIARDKGEGYSVNENSCHPDDILDCRCTLRDLQEQGVKALTKLLDTDPWFEECETGGREGNSNTTNYDDYKWESSEVKERVMKKNIERGVKNDK